MAKDNNNRNLAFATMLWVQAQTRKLELETKSIDSDPFEQWSLEFLDTLTEIYKLCDDGNYL